MASTLRFHSCEFCESLLGELETREGDRLFLNCTFSDLGGPAASQCAFAQYLLDQLRRDLTRA